MRKYSALSSTSEFQKVYKTAKKWHCEQASVYFLPSDDLRFSAVASKKIGNAVIRNRAKRRLKAMFSSFCDKTKSGHYVMIAKDTLISANYEKALKNLCWALGKLGALE